MRHPGGAHTHTATHTATHRQPQHSQGAPGSSQWVSMSTQEAPKRVHNRSFHDPIRYIADPDPEMVHTPSGQDQLIPTYLHICVCVCVLAVSCESC